MKAAIYARVSTDRQETENQLLQMTRFIESQGWARQDFIDHQSGKTDQRPQLQALFAAASRREIDVVVFWSLDRFTREGALATLQHLARLGSYGVRFRSFTEPYLDSCGVWGDAIIAILGTIAKQERLRISERVKAGLDRVRIAGSRTGRPIGRPRAIFNRAQVAERRAAGQSWRDIAAALVISTGTARTVYVNVQKPLPVRPRPAVKSNGLRPRHNRAKIGCFLQLDPGGFPYVPRIAAPARTVKMNPHS